LLSGRSLGERLAARSEVTTGSGRATAAGLGLCLESTAAAGVCRACFEGTETGIDGVIGVNELLKGVSLGARYGEKLLFQLDRDLRAEMVKLVF